MSDYISREAAIEKIRVAAGCAECNGNSSVLCVCNFCDVYNAIRLIKSLPAADVEPVRHWIPCSERMPENEGWYLTVVKPENASAFVNIYKFFAGTFHSFFQITHWMPLPEFREEDRRSDT